MKGQRAEPVRQRRMAARGGGAVFRGAQQAKEGGEDRGAEHDSIVSREAPVNVGAQKDQGGNRDRSPRQPGEAIGLGVAEAAQHKPKRMHTRHLHREAELEAEMMQPGQVRAEGGHKQLQYELVDGERVGDPHLPTESQVQVQP